MERQEQVELHNRSDGIPAVLVGLVAGRVQEGLGICNAGGGSGSGRASREPSSQGSVARRVGRWPPAGWEQSWRWVG